MCEGFEGVFSFFGVLLYFCVSDVRDIVVYEIKEVSAYSRCRKFVSFVFIIFFLCLEEYNKVFF